MASDLGSDKILWDALFRADYEFGLQRILPFRESWNASDFANFGTLGTIYQCLRKHELAAHEYALASEIAVTHNVNNDILMFGNEEGTAKWLSGRREDGARVWYNMVWSLSNGTKNMSDLSGGGGSCLLLRFAGIELNDCAMLKLAEKYVKRISNRTSFQYWPGPLARTVFEGLSFENLFETYIRKNSISVKIGEVPQDYLHRRHLSQLYFYWALNEHYQNRVEERATLLRASVNQEAIQESEWFLARHFHENGFD